MNATSLSEPSRSQPKPGKKRIGSPPIATARKTRSRR
jgi:hypothetical protein